MTGSGPLWIFGYGSLMWRPGFAHDAAEPALLRGYHRAFCVYSVHHRGTPARAGLVLGLDRGGSCRGRAYRVAAHDAEPVIAYLDAREQVTAVYLRRRVTIEIGTARVAAITYVADRAHRQYAGKLVLRRAAEIILGGRGVSGANPEYLENTVAHLDELGINDGPLHELLALVRGGKSLNQAHFE
jgi:cation transport protein ChaC